jgi:hypothetical protein
LKEVRRLTGIACGILLLITAISFYVYFKDTKKINIIIGALYFGSLWNIIVDLTYSQASPWQHLSNILTTYLCWYVYVFVAGVVSNFLLSIGEIMLVTGANPPDDPFKGML